MTPKQRKFRITVEGEYELSFPERRMLNEYSNEELIQHLMMHFERIGECSKFKFSKPKIEEIKEKGK